MSTRREIGHVRSGLAVLASFASGTGVGVALLGALLWDAGGVAEGISSAALRWSVPAATAAALSVAGMHLLLTSPESSRARAFAPWAAGVGAMLSLGTALLARPEESHAEAPDQGALSNAWFFADLAPWAFLLAGVLLAVAAVLARMVRQGETALDRASWRSWAAGAVAASLLVTTGVMLPPRIDERVHRANTEYSAPAGAVGTAASSLSGEVAWSAHDHQVTVGAQSTTGGLAVRSDSPGGVEMLDPGSGEVRWSWHRTDLGRPVDHLIASADGTLIAARFQSADQHPQPPGLVVLDAATGTVRAELSGASRSPVAVTDDQVVTVHGERELVSYSFDGESRWRLEMDEKIETYEKSFSSASADTLLVTVDTERPGWRTIAVELSTGDRLWHKDLPPRMPPLRVLPGTDLAVTSGAIAHSPYGSVVEVQEPVTARVRAVGLADGEQLWERDIEAPPGARGDISGDGCAQNANIAAHHLTVVTCTDYGRDFSLTALDPRDGEPMWHQQVPIRDEELPPSLPLENHLQALPDGSSALLRRGDHSCVIVRVGASGVDETPIEDSAVDNCGNTEWFAVGETVMLRVPEGGIHALA